MTNELLAERDLLREQKQKLQEEIEKLKFHIEMQNMTIEKLYLQVNEPIKTITISGTTLPNGGS